MSWSDERVELLKKMWGEGQSASQIAKELGGVTRNAVIGKVHRLGLSNRAGSGKAADSTKAKSDAKPAAKSKAKPPSRPRNPHLPPRQRRPQPPRRRPAPGRPSFRPASACRRSPRPMKLILPPSPRSARSRRRPRS